MNKFFYDKMFTPFDWLSLYFICRMGEGYWAWILLIFPQIIVSLLLQEYFLRREAYQKERKENEHQ